MNKNEIIESLANDNELRSICRDKITGNSDLWEDLFQDVLLVLMDASEERLKESFTNNKLKAWAIKIMLNKWNDKSRRFKNQYTSTAYLKEDLYISYTQTTTSVDACQYDIDKTLQYFTSVTPETIQATKNLERLKSEDHSEKRFPYRTELFKIFLQYGSTRNIQKEVGIHYVSASKTLKQIKEELKK